MSDDTRTLSTFRRSDVRGGLINSMVQQASAKFDPDILAAMDVRDNALVEDEIVHGVQSSAFVYSIPITGEGGKRAEGVTVIGARQLAAVYGGIQVALISSLSKRGQLFISRSYPYGGFPGRIDIQKIPDLTDEEDFYEVTIEIHDIKTGNKIPSSRREYRFEKRSEKSMARNPNQDPMFERPHLEQIAFSKAFRNAVCSIIPQDAVLQFKAKNLALNADASFVESVIDEKRAGVLRYAARNAIGLDRDAVERLTFEQIAGLSETARDGGFAAFMQSAQAMGIVIGNEGQDRPRRIVEEQKPPVGTNSAANGQQPPPKAKPATDKKPVTQAKQEQRPKFDHGATDALGEAGLDQDNIPIRFTVPADFARWYSNAYMSADGNPALAEYNADALAEASLDPVAAKILESIETPKQDGPAAGQPASKTPGTRQPVPITYLTNGAPNWPAYNAALAADLETVTGVAEFNTWKLINRTVYASPDHSGSKSNYTARIEPLIEVKEQQFDAAAQAQDHDMERAQRIISELDSLETRLDLSVYSKNPSIVKFLDRMKTEERNDIIGLLAAANKRTEARLNSAGQQEDGSPSS